MYFLIFTPTKHNLHTRTLREFRFNCA